MDFLSNLIPFAEVGKYEMAEKGDENTMYLRGKPQACVLYITQPLRGEN